MSNKETKSKRVLNALKKSANAENLVNNPDCLSDYILKKF